MTHDVENTNLIFHCCTARERWHLSLSSSSSSWCSTAWSGVVGVMFSCLCIELASLSSNNVVCILPISPVNHDFSFYKDLKLCSSESDTSICTFWISTLLYTRISSYILYVYYMVNCDPDWLSSHWLGWRQQSSGLQVMGDSVLCWMDIASNVDIAYSIRMPMCPAHKNVHSHSYL